MEIPASDDAEVSKGTVEVSALGSLYVADRADASAGNNVSIGLIATSGAYVAAALAFSEPAFEQLQWAAVVVPLPLWIVAAFHSIFVTSAMVRSLSIIAVERKLVEHAGFPAVQGQAIGIRQFEKIMNITLGKWPHRLANGLAYGGTGLILLGFTVYFVWFSPQLGICGRVASYMVYAALTAIVATSWIAGFRSYSEVANMLQLNLSPARAADKGQ